MILKLHDSDNTSSLVVSCTHSCEHGIEKALAGGGGLPV